ncbi:hypothetical protein B0A48_00860 [Cryoendolithus antarcticus]|uniref:Xylanolytic transcriptional activator regulatory domain-containing protein n=1 Tax=Cryoendolithus antarcticus TaxID=1507870 RepID=A0A1V8TRK1_9PEZI|nr:hypothetical protein B0A48_00860 [Cryoendolithus antarcticus]
MTTEATSLASTPIQSPFELEASYGDWRDDLSKNGFVVVKNAIPRDRAERYQQQAFGWLQSFDPDLDLKRPETWNLDRLPIQTERNTYEHYAVVHERFMWEARMEPGVVEAFEKIWGTTELIVSFDSLNVTLPNLKPVRDPWPHVDQAPRKRGLHCIQGIINLSKAGDNDGSLVVIPGSHRLIAEFYDTKTDPSTWELRDNRYFSKEDMEFFESRGLKPQKVLAEPGDLILWDSRTIHWGGEPEPGKSDVVRTVIYAAYAPAKLASPEALEMKQKIFHINGATTHWPHDNIKLRDLEARRPDGTLDGKHRTAPLEAADRTEILLRLADLSCTYREKGQPGLRPGFGKAVETRIDQLERTVNEIKHSLQTVLDHIQIQPNMSAFPAGDQGSIRHDAGSRAPRGPNVELPDMFWIDAAPLIEQRKAYVKTARERILLATIDDCTLLSAQALALAAVDALGQGTGPRAWNSMSLLATAAKHLELSKSQSLEFTERSTPLVANDPDDDGELSIVQAEERKRLLWAICSLDRFSSVSHGQPGGIDMRNIRLPYPKSDDQWEQNSPDRWYQAPTVKSSFHEADTGASYDVWHHYIDALAFVDRSNQFLIQPVNLMVSVQCQEWQSNFRRLDTSLSSWFNALPAQVREPQTMFSPAWVMLQATVYLRSLPINDFTSLSPGDLDCLPPMFAFVLWVAARSLAILWTTHHESTPGPDMDALLNGLRQMAIRWPCAQRYADLLQLIMDDTDSEARPKLLEIFNDTRRTAYGLEKKLGKIAGSPSASQDLFSFDFLDMPFLDNDINDGSWLPLFSDNAVNDWL